VVRQTHQREESGDDDVTGAAGAQVMHWRIRELAIVIHQFTNSTNSQIAAAEGSHCI
jgi:hypothetical protein